MAEGYKDWAAGDILTAADLEDYTVKQSVMRFADASARTTALSGVLAEGMVSYLKDTNRVEVYDGSAWAAVGGKILQVVRVTKNDNFTTSSTSLVDVTGMSITITPTLSTSNILIVTAFTGVHYSSSTDNLRGVYVIADSANNPISGTNNAVVGSEALTGTGSREFWSMVNLMSYDAPATTSATTYKLRTKAESSLANVSVSGATNLAQMYALEVLA